MHYERVSTDAAGSQRADDINLILVGLIRLDAKVDEILGLVSSSAARQPKG